MSSSTPRPLKIGLVFDDSLDSNDGVAQYAKRVGLWLEGQGHKVSYLVGESTTRKWGNSPVYSLAKNLPVRWGGNNLSFSFISHSRQIKRLLADSQFDVLHVQFPYSPFMAQRVINRAYPQTAVIATVHVFPANWLGVIGSRLLKIVYARSLRRFDSFISVSPAAQKYALDNFGVKSKIVPNTVDISAFKSDEPSKADVKRIVFLGRLVERKGCRYLLKAFKLLAAAQVNIELVIAGDGPQRKKLERLAKRYGIAERIKFLGFVSEVAKPKLFASADIACFPSMYGESFGIVLIEAMAAGAKIVIGGDNPGYRSVLGSQPLLLLNPKKTAEFATRLAELLNDSRAIDELHTWQLNEVQRYDIQNVGKQLINTYNAAIAMAKQREHN